MNLNRHLSRHRQRGLRQSVLVLLIVLLILSSVLPVAAESDEMAESDGAATDANPELSVAPGAELTAETAEQFLDAFFSSPEVAAEFVGSVVTIVHDGEAIVQKGYGFADVDAQTAVDPENTLFRVASVSKTFEAVAIMQLAEQGLLELETDIRDYLPELLLDNPFAQPVTVADLLTHRSGFETRDPKVTDFYDDLSLHFGMLDYAQQNMPDIVREPGTGYMYDNFGYLLLALIVEEVSGQPFADYMEEHVFQPLGMENSSFVINEENRDQIAVAYDAVGEPVGFYMVKPTIFPHGGMVSTVADMGQFMSALLNGGALPSGERILSPESTAAMMEYRSAIHPLLPDTTYGFEAAFQIPQVGSPDGIVTKAGDLPGFSSYLVLIPGENTGLFLSTNQTSTLRTLLYQQFLMTFYPELTAPQPLQPRAGTPQQLEEISGLYADLRLGSMVTSVEAGEDGTLIVSDAFLGPRTLQQVDDNLFVDEAGMFTAFVINEENGEVYLKEPYLNPLGYASQGEEAQGFQDVPEHYPYAAYIYSLQSLGHLPNDPSQSFTPEAPVTRGEFVRLLLVTSDLPGSTTTDYAFTDIAGHADAAYIQAAAEQGLIVGDGEGAFAPDRHISREEAAVMLWASARQLYPDELFVDVEIAGDTSPWAVPAVKMMVAFQLYGPEVVKEEGAPVDYLSQQVLKRQEAAAILFLSLVQPIDLLLAERAAKSMEPMESTEAEEAA